MAPRHRLALTALVALATLAPSGCSSELFGELTGRTGPPRVPNVEVETDLGPDVSAPWTWCYDDACVDGAQPPSRSLVDVGSGESFEFSWPDDGWEFEATFHEPASDCPRTITVPAEPLGAHRYRVPATGPAGRWLVDLFGSGPSGDAITTVRWETTVDGPDETIDREPACR